MTRISYSVLKMNYQVVTATSLNNLVASVNEKMKQGYEPIGGFAKIIEASIPVYCQTMYSQNTRYTPPQTISKDEVLYNKLKNKRKELADKIAAPAYIVATNRMLDSLIGVKPKNKEELKSVYGFGEQRIQLYGDEFLSVVNSSSV